MEFFFRLWGLTYFFQHFQKELDTECEQSDHMNSGSNQMFDITLSFSSARCNHSWGLYLV